MFAAIHCSTLNADNF